jgi:alkanesulfonate monooxygenase SsuD/methylene tetrahydromethanopterin reductase-like flavin-dependent oxidoreductase (luciferase family)
MRFGVFPGPIFPGDMPPATSFVFALDTARVARGGGFDGVFVGQHYLAGPIALNVQSPSSLLARVAGECPGLDLGTAIFVLPLHHLIEIAEATVTLDWTVTYGGRLILGVGAGYRQIEFESVGTPVVGRGRRSSRAAKRCAYFGPRSEPRPKATYSSSMSQHSTRAPTEGRPADLGRCRHGPGCGFVRCMLHW